jgi:hypothetical protein
MAMAMAQEWAPELVPVMMNFWDLPFVLFLASSG